MMDYKQKSFAIAALRRASYRWPSRNNALKAAKIARNQYVCQICKNVYTKREVQLDHLIPVVPTTGWDSFDMFVERLFCYDAGYQLICKPCHYTKTQGENTIRRENKKALTKK